MTANSSAITVGTEFIVTTTGLFISGFWLWVCPAGQSTSAQTFALWQVTSAATGTLVAGSPLTSGTLVPGSGTAPPTASRWR